MRDRAVCVLGLGYVGLTLASVLADVGFEVHGTEIRPEILDRLRRAQPHFHEPGLPEALERHLRKGRMHLHPRIPDGCPATAYIVTVGTPLGPDGHVRLDMIREAVGEVGAHAAPGDLVILRSTVKLGTTRQLAASLLRPEILASFCPERTLEGQALAELRELPQIVGSLTEEASDRASTLFHAVTPTVVRVGKPETAEMIKLVSNAHRDVQFAYANEIARMCDAWGISAAEVIRGGGLGYARTRLPMPGPVGGPCLSKDSHILAESFNGCHVRPEITIAGREVNERLPEESADFIARTWETRGGRPKRLALLGFAFKGKPVTDDTRGTPAAAILRALARRFPEAQIVGWDPVVPAAEIESCGASAARSVSSAVLGADVVVLMNNHPILSGLDLAAMAQSLARPALVYDFWNLFAGRELELPADVRYVALGSHSA